MEFTADFGLDHFKKVSLSDLSEVRRLLKPYLARKAAETFTKKDWDQLDGFQKNCQQLYAQGGDPAGTKAKIDFHVFLAERSGNIILLMILDFVNTLLMDLKQRINPEQKFRQNVIDAHQNIIDAIKFGDADHVETFMLEHIEDVEAILKKIESGDK